MKNLSVILFLAIVLMGGFVGGWNYAQSHPLASVTTSNTGAAGAGAGARAAAAGGGRAGGFAGLGGGGAAAIVGQITAVNGNTITVHNRITNTDVKVQIDSSTTITNQVAATQSDLATSQNVTVVGPASSNGTVSARSIAIGGAARAGGFGAFGGGAPAPSPTP
ncbi:MAG TPA: DUF5666 domain-containing protein [Candidatus Nitrosotalea sp.]|nr:DUF5666 domain-containing protein [Candidatus Nitrosotalea sp.]